MCGCEQFRALAGPEAARESLAGWEFCVAVARAKTVQHVYLVRGSWSTPSSWTRQYLPGAECSHWGRVLFYMPYVKTNILAGIQTSAFDLN